MEIVSRAGFFADCIATSSNQVSLLQQLRRRRRYISLFLFFPLYLFVRIPANLDLLFLLLPSSEEEVLLPGK